MAHVSLYRKYRPHSFAEVVGQDHVTETLARAVDGQSWHHAYLFCGPRGTGKTSSARLLAMGLNASTGPTSSPDPNDPIVVAIREGSCPDVIEIDAASNSGVDDVRDLRDKIAYSPTQGRLRIYIVDECHMLSNSAWNAFLKTIEEPPGHVVFIFATTEPHKVLPTVLSRTQRFDFRRVSDQVLTAHCKKICAAEGVAITDEALAPIVRAGDGSVRDTLSVLDQVIAFTGNHIDAQAVNRVLGTVPGELLNVLVNAIARADVADAFALVGQVAEQGIDLRQFALDAQNHLRELLILSAAPEAGLIEGTPERLAELKASAASADTDRLLFAVELLNDAQVRMRAGNTRLPLEVALAKAVLNGADRIKDVPRIAPSTSAPIEPTLSAEPTPPTAPAPLDAQAPRTAQASPISPTPEASAQPAAPVEGPEPTAHEVRSPEPQPFNPVEDPYAPPMAADTATAQAVAPGSTETVDPAPPHAVPAASMEEAQVHESAPEPEQAESLFDDMPALTPEPTPRHLSARETDPDVHPDNARPLQVDPPVDELAPNNPAPNQSTPAKSPLGDSTPVHSSLGDLAEDIRVQGTPALGHTTQGIQSDTSPSQDSPVSSGHSQTAPTTPGEAIAPANAPEELTLAEVSAVWDRVLDQIMGESKRIWSIFSQGAPIKVAGTKIVIGFRYPFHTSMAAEADAVAVTSRHYSALLGTNVKVSTETNAEATPAPPPEPDPSTQVVVEDYEPEVEDSSSPADNDERFREAVALVKSELGAMETE